MIKQHSQAADLLLAHRGYAARYPENTLPAIAAAVVAGAKLIEFDVQLTADHVPVLLHDADFQRTGGRSERVMDIDFAQTLGIDVPHGTQFGQQFAGTRAPRLADIVSHLREWPHVTAFVELKRQSLEHFGVDVVLDAVLKDLATVLEQCVLISFEADVLFAAKRRLQIPIGWALRRYDDKSRQLATELSPAYLFCNQTRLPATAYELWQGSWKWVVYEVVDAQVAEKLFARGVSIIETMQYPEMAQALTERAGDR
jgi:glycerophosphoryl diester phosphodiesterase